MDKTNLDWAKDVPCRNITIHGFCKYEGKGCSFKHNTAKSAAAPPAAQQEPQSAPPVSMLNNMSINNRPTTASSGSITSGPAIVSTEPRKKFNPASSSVFTPSGSLNTSAAPSLSQPVKSSSALSGNKFANLSPKFSDIQAFVPSSMSSDIDGPDNHFGSMKQFNLDTPAFQPASAPFLPQHTDQQSAIPLPQGLHASSAPLQQHQPSPFPVPQQPQQQSHPQLNPYSQQHPDHQSMNPYSSMATSAQDFMFQSHPPPQSTFPLQHHLYAPTPPPHLQIPLKGNEQNAEMLFIPNKLREALTRKNEATLKTMGHIGLPDMVAIYYDLYPLDNTLTKNDKSYGYKSSVYKAFSNSNGRAYTLRRIENVKISKDRSLSTINQWIKLKSSNIAQICDAFTSRSFGDNSLIIVYDFYPDAKTLYEYHFHPTIGKPEPITPELLWTYMTQISSAIAAAHSKGLAIRSISLNKILLTSKNRVRLSDCGVFDILDYKEDSTSQTVQDLQLQDLTQFGKVLLSLASAKLPATIRSLDEQDVLQHVDMDKDFKNALEYLLDDSSTRTITAFQKLIVHRLFNELDKMELNADYYEAQLTREVENARLFRLLTKINFIVDRPEYELNPNWAKTGDRYPIKLFREYVFHQIDEKGKPVLDLAHVLRCLNKLDAGIEERVLLVSPDEQSCLIVSYKELKDLIAKSFHELTKE